MCYLKQELCAGDGMPRSRPGRGVSSRSAKVKPCEARRETLLRTTCCSQGRYEAVAQGEGRAGAGGNEREGAATAGDNTEGCGTSVEVDG